MAEMITAAFGCSKTTKTERIWQYDYGRKLQICGVNLPSAVEVHFALDESGEAEPRIGVTENGITTVAIPDKMLETDTVSDYLIYAYVYVTDETSGQTRYKITIPVKSRPKPSDRVITKDGIMTYKDIDKRVEALEDTDHLFVIHATVDNSVEPTETITKLLIDKTNEEIGTAYQAGRAIAINYNEIFMLCAMGIYTPDSTYATGIFYFIRLLATDSMKKPISVAAIMLNTDGTSVAIATELSLHGLGGALPYNDDVQAGSYLTTTNGVDQWTVWPFPAPTAADANKVLGVTNGGVYSLITPSGDGTGKSAYQYAVEGGYTGTEAEFAAKLAREGVPVPTAEDAGKFVKVTDAGGYELSDDLGLKIPSNEPYNDFIPNQVYKASDGGLWVSHEVRALNDVSQISNVIGTVNFIIVYYSTHYTQNDEYPLAFPIFIINKGQSYGVFSLMIIDNAGIIYNGNWRASNNELTITRQLTLPKTEIDAKFAEILSGDFCSRTDRVVEESTDTEVTIEPNKLYIFPEMATLNLTLMTPADTSIANEYHVVFKSGATATELSLPDTVKLPSGFSVAANKIYELSILEDCLASSSWEAT